MNAPPKMSRADPLVDMGQWAWPYGPFVLADCDGNRWKLSACDPFDSGKTAQLICETHTEIDGVTYEITGSQSLRADGSPVAEASLRSILPPPAYANNPRGVQRRALAMVRKALDGPYAQAACIRGAAIARLPLSQRMKINEQTRLALASKQEIEADIADLREWLKPGGREDQITAQLIAELGAIRINGAKKRLRVEETAAALHARTRYRAERKDRLQRCQARLAVLRSTED